MAVKSKKDSNMLMYREKPLVRNGSTIYYGDMAGPYVAVLQTMGTQDFADMKLPSKVSVQILSTDEELRLKERIVKKTEKNSLYEALNIATIWLERILEE